VEIAAAVFAEIEDEGFHALVLEVVESGFDFAGVGSRWRDVFPIAWPR
jgi:hypothetical protein